VRQAGFAAGQQRSPAATSVGGQQTGAPSGRATRAFGQQVSPAGVATQVVFGPQHSLPQHVFVFAQQRSPQHFCCSLQHVSPQHVAVLAQQWFAKQHFCLAPQHLPLQHARPLSQQLWPQRRVPLGQLLRHVLR
jgi:hypothetical protein